MKKIVFLNHWARQMGGAEFSLLELLRYAATRFDCLLVTAENGPLAEEAKKLGISHVCVSGSKHIESIKRDALAASVLKNLPAFFSYLFFVLRLFVLLKKIKPDLIHANVPKSHVALGLILRMGAGGKGMMHIREIFAGHTLPFYLYRFLFTRKTVGIAISRAVYESLPFSLQKRSTIIYNGITIPHVGHNVNRGKKPLRLLYLGRIVPWKGCHELLDIVEGLMTGSRHIVTLSLVGSTAYWDDDYRSQLKSRIKNSPALVRYVKLMEHQQDVGLIFRAHDIFCTTSYREPFGRSTAEAQAHGLPAIAYDSGGADEIILHGKTGFLVKWGDRAGFEKAIITLCENRALLKKMGTNGAHHAEKMFDSARQGRKQVTFLMRTINSERMQQLKRG